MICVCCCFSPLKLWWRKVTSHCTGVLLYFCHYHYCGTVTTCTTAYYARIFHSLYNLMHDDFIRARTDTHTHVITRTWNHWPQCNQTDTHAWNDTIMSREQVSCWLKPQTPGLRRSECQFNCFNRLTAGPWPAPLPSVGDISADFISTELLNRADVSVSLFSEPRSHIMSKMSWNAPVAGFNYSV